MKLVKVPFYENTPGGTRCWQACLKVVLKYFLPEREFSWEELDRMTAKKRGLWTWAMQGMITLAKMGFEVERLWDFDYKKFSEQGKRYLQDRYGKEIAAIQLRYSDLKQELRVAQEFVRLFGAVTRPAKFSDIRKFMEKGFVLICNVNSQVLKDQPGWTGHFVVVTGLDRKRIYFHDPGLPGRKNRRISREKFRQAWGYPTRPEPNVMAFRLA